MARIYQVEGKKGPRWYLDYQVEGRRVRKRIGKSKRLAELALADIEVKLERKETGFAVKDRNLADFIAEYLNFAKGNKALQSYQRDEMSLRHLTGFLQVDRLGAVTPSLLEAYKADRLGKGTKPSTLNRELNTIKAMFNKAMAWGALAKNPAVSVRKLKETHKKIRYLSRDEVALLLKAASERMRPVIETFLHTGFRRDELIHLTWADVDFKNKVVSVQAKDGWHPKDYETRHIPLTARLAEVLRGVPKADEECVFRNGGGKALDADVLSHEFRRLVRSCALKNASIHTLRHTFASHLVMNSVDLYTVQKLLGHSSIKTTEIYAHLAPDYLRAAMDKLRY
jgi:site-specific recombinase XerD